MSSMWPDPDIAPLAGAYEQWRARLDAARHTPGGVDHDQSDHGAKGQKTEPVKTPDDAPSEKTKDFYVSFKEKLAARRLVADKFKTAKKPTRAETAAQKKLYKEKGAANVEKNQRGSAADRRVSRKRLLEEFGDGKTAPCCYCGKVLTDATLERDRLWPGSIGGRYKFENIMPADSLCNKERSDRPFQEVLDGWALETTEARMSTRGMDRGKLPPDGTICKGTVAVGPDADHEAEPVEGPLQTTYVEVLDFIHTSIGGVTVDPASVVAIEKTDDIPKVPTEREDPN